MLLGTMTEQRLGYWFSFLFCQFSFQVISTPSVARTPNPRPRVPRSTDQAAFWQKYQQDYYSGLQGAESTTPGSSNDAQLRDGTLDILDIGAIFNLILISGKETVVFVILQRHELPKGILTIGINVCGFVLGQNTRMVRGDPVTISAGAYPRSTSPSYRV